MSDITNNQREVIKVKDSVSGVPFGVKGSVADGSINVNVTSGGTGGTQYTDGGATVTHPVGTMPVYDNAGTISKVGTSGGLPVQQQGTWNITNISGTVTLPTGAATAAKQPSLGSAGLAATDVITVQGITSMTALKIDGSAVTQPVSLASLPTLASGTNAIGTTGTTSAAVNVGQQTVGTSAVQLKSTSTVPTNGIIVRALSTNGASIFVGGSGVTTSTGYELVAGESISFTCNLNTLYIISAASTSDKVCYNVE